MSEFEQNYNFENPNQQPFNLPPDEKEEKTVKALLICWAVSLASTFILFFVALIVGEYSEIAGACIEFVTEALVVSYHVIAIVGKIKYPHNHKMDDIFVIDMVILGITAAILIVVVSLGMLCDWMCGDCG